MEIPSQLRHIHLIAICGTGMGSLAGLLVEKGFHVTGSDQNIYPPMSTQLAALGIPLFEGFKPENLNPKPDLVIVGNAVSRNNPEVEAMVALNIPYASMPQALSHFFITGKKSVVVTGTHGKTTTTALLSHLLLELKADPSYLIGGILQGDEKNYRSGSGQYFVVEGDEYDTAFFDKGPKFLHYQPYYTLITSLEFDHADIYRNMEHMSGAFQMLLEAVHPKGFLLACADYPELTRILSLSRAPYETYSLSHLADWRAEHADFSGPFTTFDVTWRGKKETRLFSPLAGKHNLLNTLAAFAILRKLGFNADDIVAALKTFKGVKRRQEVRGVVNDKVVIDDFAHHPTAVLETIDAVRKRYPGYHLTAVFEPRSNSSKRNVFQADYARAFSAADEVVLADVFMPEKVPAEIRLDIGQLTADISKNGPPATHLPGADEIVAYLTPRTKPKTVILVMSNGGFGGIHQKLLNALGSATQN